MTRSEINNKINELENQKEKIVDELNVLREKRNKIQEQFNPDNLSLDGNGGLTYTDESGVPFLLCYRTGEGYLQLTYGIPNYLPFKLDKNNQLIVKAIYPIIQK